MDTKKNIKIGAAVVVLAIVVWQAIGLFGGGSAAETKPLPNPDIPKQATLLPKPVQKPLQDKQSPQQDAAMTERESQLMTIQKETQARYIAALNELQMLKVDRDIALTNKDILKAKEDSANSLRKMVETLAPKDSGRSSNSSQMMTTTVVAPPTPTNTLTVNTAPPPPAPVPPGDNYVVVSVSNIHGRWSAILNGNRNLYSVRVGDVLAEEGSTVVSIDRSGVVIEKSGIKKKVTIQQVI